jgi:hypothetical protein
MPPKDGGKGTFSLRNDEIRRNTATLGTGVRDIVDGDVPAMFHIDFLDIQRRLGIIIKGAGRTGVLREQRCCAKEKGGCYEGSHQASPSPVRIDLGREET